MAEQAVAKYQEKIAKNVALVHASEELGTIVGQVKGLELVGDMVVANVEVFQDHQAVQTALESRAMFVRSSGTGSLTRRGDHFEVNNDYEIDNFFITTKPA